MSNLAAGPYNVTVTDANQCTAVIPFQIGSSLAADANAGADTINSIKQAAEFGIVRGGQRLAGLLVFVTDVHALGLQSAEGLVITNSFYWDMNDKTRAGSQRFMAMNDGRLPTMIHAGTYSGILHYLRAGQAANSTDPKVIAAKMHESWTTCPRVTNFDDADVTELERLRVSSKDDYAKKAVS